MAVDKAEDKDADKDDDLPVVKVIIEGEAEDASPPADEKVAAEEKVEKKDDRRAKDDGDDDPDEKEADNLSPEEREALRKKRREEKALRRQRAKEKEEARERELAELKRTVQDLTSKQTQQERRASESDFNRIEAGITASLREMEQAKGLMADALVKQNGAAHAEALDAYTEARARAEYLNRLKHGIVSRQQEDRTPKVDPEVARHARSWMAKNTWYDPKGGDEDSMIALAVDDALSKSGYDPRTREYWTEFEKRVAKRLPHRVTKADDELDDDRDERGSQTSGSGRERAAGAQQTYRLSKARVDAMKEAGIWEDEKARAKQIKAYMDYDKQAQQKDRK